MSPDGVGDQQDAQEGRRRGQQLDPMGLDGRANGVRAAICGGDDGAAVAKPVQQRVDAADMVEQKEDQRAIGRPRHLELRQQPIEIEHRGLAFAGRARAEQDQAGCVARHDLPQQRMVRGAVEAGDAPRIVTVELHRELDLRQLHQSVPTRRGRRCQRDDDVAVRHRGQKQRAELRRIVAADRQRISRPDPVLANRSVQASQAWPSWATTSSRCAISAPACRPRIAAAGSANGGSWPSARVAPRYHGDLDQVGRVRVVGARPTALEYRFHGLHRLNGVHDLGRLRRLHRL